MRTGLAATLITCLMVSLPGLPAAGELAPLPRDQAVSTHGPYEAGSCETCHVRRDPEDPGPASVTDETCFDCHDEFRGRAKVKLEKSIHPRDGDKSCLGCHSPHNARNRKLLLRP